ncbi:pyridoxamine 5'-phosphate oxidase [Streptomyces sp. NRRL B-1140]|uniref:pyridoxamine 5'-phosphate oxidase family protein n=1 Tax=Streptomyces sp. NRRL B-1140 TaxID=1415549 RepID=UPI0006B030D4|nr:pyridoxamine 5'-phosphate oxidase family protein [Streptomyces sp. NRRL B-1140]KOV95519.1 pyridoxamine 5'-phosphate oxidase [Streptomyces sp. NRRL B-1140]
MSSVVMTREEREAFLSEIHIGVLAVERPGRAPLAVPLWYDYTPGGDVLILVNKDSLKFGLIRQAGRLTLVVQREEWPYAYVSVEGPVVNDEDEVPTDEVAMNVVRRYLDEPDARSYVDQALTPERARLIRMRPDKWLSNDQTKA